MRDIEKYTKDYGEEPCENYQVKYRRKKVLNLLKNYKHDNILEIGCGNEPLFEYMTDYKQMVIVEPSSAFAESAKAKSKNSNKIKIIEGFLEDSIDELKRTKVDFDYIVISSLLHEVEEPEKLMNCVKQLCSNNTIIHINVPNAYSIHRIIAENMGLLSNVHELSELQKKMQRNRVYDINMLKSFLTDLNFDVIESGSYFPKLFSAGQMEKMLDLGIVDEKIFEGLDKLIDYIPEYGSEIYVQLIMNGKDERNCNNWR